MREEEADRESIAGKGWMVISCSAFCAPLDAAVSLLPSLVPRLCVKGSLFSSPAHSASADIPASDFPRFGDNRYVTPDQK